MVTLQGDKNKAYLVTLYFYPYVQNVWFFGVLEAKTSLWYSNKQIGILIKFQVTLFLTSERFLNDKAIFSSSWNWRADTTDSEWLSSSRSHSLWKITSKDVGKTSVIYFQYLANFLPQRDVQRTRRFLGQLGELIPVTDLHSADCIWEEIQCNVLY